MSHNDNPDGQLDDLRQQVSSAMAMLSKLRIKCELIRNKMLSRLDQGEGLSHDELLEIYVEISKLLPQRV